SVGEVRPMRGPGRREIGHGALAERALKSVIPLEDPDFPYTLLLTSEVLESNGSTSMASVCGSTLALMDAGIQIKAPVAGIAMGLMTDGKTFKILTDIQGMEDFSGDMDFKVAGTRKGITALQLDTKLEGIPDEVLSQALTQAKVARLKILDVIEEEISARLMGRGAMVEYINGREGLVPMEQLTVKAVRRPDDVVSVGDELNVKVHEVDGLGRINLTALGLPQTLPSLSENESATPPPPGLPRGGGRDRGGRGGDRDRGRGGGGRGGDRDRGG